MVRQGSPINNLTYSVEPL